MPALVDEGRVITESAAIQLYLAEKYPQTGFIPSTVEERAQSFLVPSLGKRGLYAMMPLGHLSAHTPGLVGGMIDYAHQFSAIFVRLLISDDPPHVLKRYEHSELAGALVAAEVLQALYVEHQEVLHPSIDDWLEDEEEQEPNKPLEPTR